MIFVDPRQIARLALTAVVFLFGLTGLAQNGDSNPATARPPSSTRPPNANEDDQSTTFKVNVKLVNVFATVVDEHGSPVAGLKKEDFTLWEDKRPQKIAFFGKESALPLSIVMAIDASLSTRKDLKLETESARRFVHAILRPVDALTLYQFSDAVDEMVTFTPDLRRIDVSFLSVSQEVGLTWSSRKPAWKLPASLSVCCRLSPLPSVARRPNRAASR